MQTLTTDRMSQVAQHTELKVIDLCVKMNLWAQCGVDDDEDENSHHEWANDVDEVVVFSIDELSENRLLHRSLSK